MRCFADFASGPRLSAASSLTIPAFTTIPLAAYAVTSPSLAQDHEYGAYLCKGACSMFSPDLVIKDIGDLEIEKDATKEWARVSPDKAKMPNTAYVEGESTAKVNAKQLA